MLKQDMHEHLDEDDYPIMALEQILLNLDQIYIDLINEEFLYLLLYLNQKNKIKK